MGFEGPTPRQERLQAEAKAKGGLTSRGIKRFEKTVGLGETPEEKEAIRTELVEREQKKLRQIKETTQERQQRLRETLRTRGRFKTEKEAIEALSLSGSQVRLSPRRIKEIVKRSGVRAGVALVGAALAGKIRGRSRLRFKEARPSKRIDISKEEGAFVLPTKEEDKIIKGRKIKIAKKIEISREISTRPTPRHETISKEPELPFFTRAPARGSISIDIIDNKDSKLKSEIKKIKQQFLGKASRGQVGVIPQLIFKATESQRGSKGQALRSRGGTSIKIIENGIIGLIGGTGTGLAAKTIIKNVVSARSLPTVLKIIRATKNPFRISYGGNVVGRISETKGTGNLLVEFSGDVGFFKGLKIGTLGLDKIITQKLTTKEGRIILNDVLKKPSGKKATPVEIKAKFRTLSNAGKAKFVKAFVQKHKKLPDVLEKIIPTRLIRSKAASVGGVGGKRFGRVKRTKAQQRPIKPTKRKQIKSKVQRRKESLQQYFDPNLKLIRDRRQLLKISHPKNSQLKTVKQRLTESGDYVVQHKYKTEPKQLVTKFEKSGGEKSFLFKSKVKTTKLFPKGFGTQAKPKTPRISNVIDIMTINRAGKSSSINIITSQKLKGLNKFSFKIEKRKPIKKITDTGSLQIIQTIKNTRLEKPLTIEIPKRTPTVPPEVFIKGFRTGKSTEKLFERIRAAKEARIKELATTKQKKGKEEIRGTPLSMKALKKLPLIEPPQYNLNVIPTQAKLPSSVFEVNKNQLPSNMQKYIESLGVSTEKVLMNHPAVRVINPTFSSQKAKQEKDSVLKSYFALMFDPSLTSKERTDLSQNIKESVRQNNINDQAAKEFLQDGIIGKQDIKQQQKEQLKQNQIIKEKLKLKQDQILKKLKSIKPNRQIQTQRFTPKSIQQSIKRQLQKLKIPIVPLPPEKIPAKKKKQLEELDALIKKLKKSKKPEIEFALTPTLGGIGKIQRRVTGFFSPFEERGSIVRLKPIPVVRHKRKTLVNKLFVRKHRRAKARR